MLFVVIFNSTNNSQPYFILWIQLPQRRNHWYFPALFIMNIGASTPKPSLFPCLIYYEYRCPIARTWPFLTRGATNICRALQSREPFLRKWNQIIGAYPSFSPSTFFFSDCLIANFFLNSVFSTALIFLHWKKNKGSVFNFDMFFIAIIFYFFSNNNNLLHLERNTFFQRMLALLFTAQWFFFVSLHFSSSSFFQIFFSNFFKFFTIYKTYVNVWKC